MVNIGRPKGKNNKEYVYSLRMDEDTKKRLEDYCKRMHVPKSDALREAIQRLTQKLD